jgi:hypothetical protein
MIVLSANFLAAESEFSTALIPKPLIGHDSEPFSSTSDHHNLFSKGLSLTFIALSS